MSEILQFRLSEGILECNHTKRTAAIIKKEVSRLSPAITSCKEALKAEKMDFIFYGRNMSLGVSASEAVNVTLLGGEGAVLEGKRCKYDVILRDLNKPKDDLSDDA